MWISTPPAQTKSKLSQMSIVLLLTQICTCTIYLQTCQKKTKDSITPFGLGNLSNDQYLEFPENHIVAFTGKENTEGDVFKIEQVDITPRNWIPVQSQRSVAEIAKLDMETDLHSILTSASSFIKSPAEVEAHRKVDVEDKKIKEETRQEFNKLCDQFDDIISKGSDDIGKIQLVEMDIDTGDFPPNSFQTLHSVTKVL